MTDTARPRPFNISITENDQRDLKARLQRARLPNQQEGVAWEQGTSLHYLQVRLQGRCASLWDVGGI